jgi:hypothetical protein
MSLGVLGELWKVNDDADFALSGGNDVLRRFDRESRWLAAGLDRRKQQWGRFLL